jgi:hypothetical protein
MDSDQKTNGWFLQQTVSLDLKELKSEKLDVLAYVLRTFIRQREASELKPMDWLTSTLDWRR